MWYISFHGSVNNIRVYEDSGEPHSKPDLLPTGETDPSLRELRGFEFVGNLLYVVNAYNKYSQILLYEADASGAYTPASEPYFASRDSVNSILHPFDLTFDPEGNCYISSQDTNVVTALRGANKPLPGASYLRQCYPSPDRFLAGTFVASSVGALPRSPEPFPLDVALPQGLDLGFADPSRTQVAHSVRGVVFHEGYLYVADEPADAVKVYNGKTGELHGQIKGDPLSAPVHLLLHNGVLYIGSTGNDSVVCCDLSGCAPSGITKPTSFIKGHVKHVSGIAFDADNHFYAAERHARKIKRFTHKGKKIDDFIAHLSDEPEFIYYALSG